MSKRTIGADGLDELLEHRPGWFAVTVKDSNGLQVGYAYAQQGERFQLGKDGRLIPFVMIPVDKPPTQSAE